MKEKDDVTSDFFKYLQARTITLTPNDKMKNMYVVNDVDQKTQNQVPIGGIILSSKDSIGTKYYSETDIMTAMQEFAEKINKEEITEEKEDNEKKEKHIVTKVTQVNMEEFAEVINKAAKIYFRQNTKVTTQDARIVQKTIEKDGEFQKKDAGGAFLGNSGKHEGIDNDVAYINEADIRVAITEFFNTKIIPIVPPIILIIPEPNKEPVKAPEEKHVVTNNKGKIKKNFKKISIVAITTLVMLMGSLQSCEANMMGGQISPRIDYIEDVESAPKDETIKVDQIDIDANIKSGIGTPLIVNKGTKYMKTTEKKENEEEQKTYTISKDNEYVNPGDQVTINGISINNEDGEIVASIYDDTEGIKLEVETFILNNAPKEEATYKVFVHIKTDKTDLGWLMAGTTKIVIEKSEQSKDLYVISTQDGEVLMIVKPDGSQIDVNDLPDLDTAPQDTQDKAREQITKKANSSIEKDQDMEIN